MVCQIISFQAMVGDLFQVILVGKIVNIEW